LESRDYWKDTGDGCLEHLEEDEEVGDGNEGVSGKEEKAVEKYAAKLQKRFEGLLRSKKASLRELKLLLNMSYAFWLVQGHSNPESRDSEAVDDVGGEYMMQHEVWHIVESEWSLVKMERDVAKRVKRLERMRASVGEKVSVDATNSEPEEEPVEEGAAESVSETVKKLKLQSRKRQRTTDSIEPRPLDTFDPTTPRTVSRTILKNKNARIWTRPRKAIDRNPRVKKRKRYDQALKKQASLRPRYKAPAGRYDGEDVGIRRSITRGVKLS